MQYDRQNGIFGVELLRTVTLCTEIEQVKRNYPRRARSALGVDTVFTLDVCLYVCMYVCMYVSALERKRLIGMT